MMELIERPKSRLTGIQRVLEVGMIITTAFALFLFIALATFDSADPGWSQTGFNEHVHNAGGPVGAWLADISLWIFGVIAYTFPFAIALLGWFIFQRAKDILELDYLTIALRMIGTILCILGAAGLSSINFDDLATVSSGGMVGEAISHALIPFFSIVGTNLLLLCFLATGFTLLTGISWLSIIDGLGAFSIFTAKKVYRLPSTIEEIKSLPNPLSRSGQALTDKNKPSSIEITTMRVDPEIPKKSGFFSNNAEELSDTMIEEMDEYDAIPEREPPVTVQVVNSANEERASVNREVSTAPKTPKVISPQESEKVAGNRPMPEGDVPSFELLDKPNRTKEPISQEELDSVARLLEATLADFSVQAQVVGVYPGPVVTRFELDLAPGVKVSKISGLSKDLARAMSALSVRVVEVIPGKSYIGLELPNKHRETVFLREVISSEYFENAKSSLTMVLGKDISGDPVVVDLAKMPHLLVAGTTGSGKSVGVNVMILSLLYKSTPEDVRFIMIDPKMLELSVYEGIPHLLAEVVTDMKEASNALRWCVGEMERRYRLMSALGVRNLKGYNAKVLEAKENGQPIKDPLWNPNESMAEEAPELEKLPSIVVVVDEFADMMMIVGKKVEELIARIAQKARAAGIHLILATQRPSVDVITGLIKANIPTRIAFQVSSKIDSRTILDQQGAEALLGMGDMLYLPPGSGVPTRVHGAFVDDHEVHAVVADWQSRGTPQYIDEILSGESNDEILLPGEQPDGGDQELDPFYDEAVAFVTETRRASVSGVQRKFRIGYNRAARLVEQMEQSGVVSAPGHNGNRDVLAPPPPRG
ncbi:DNA translocase FtsK [Paraneptunicella aestuarii]|uniref:DNA translocase FtsK n=1 Tax=Paraneptunicella aestuarii TaxID=2831148 RepID=UPI001E5B514F|nr:DNA translocase FtsK 4TM domain-containing protein [Paraneptunicella aestuarii]